MTEKLEKPDESLERMNETLKRMLKTPPKPHKDEKRPKPGADGNVWKWSLVRVICIDDYSLFNVSLDRPELVATGLVIFLAAFILVLTGTVHFQK